MMHLQALKLYLLSEFDKKSYICLFKIKQNFKMAKNRDVDINPRLSRNEPLLQVTDFDRECHIFPSPNHVYILEIR